MTKKKKRKKKKGVGESIGSKYSQTIMRKEVVKLFFGSNKFVRYDLINMLIVGRYLSEKLIII